MKKFLSALLTLTLLFSLSAPALAAAPTTPDSPSWLPDEDYMTFLDDPVYKPAAWAEIEALRTAAEAGSFFDEDTETDWPEGSVGYCYEIALIRLKQGSNEYAQTGKRSAFYPARRAFAAASSAWISEHGKLYDDPEYNELRLWFWRAMLLERYRPLNGESYVTLVDRLGITVDELFDAPFMEIVTDEERAELKQLMADYQAEQETERIAAASRVELWLDGQQITDSDVEAEILNGRTMIPVRVLAERLGADATWDGENKQAILSRAGVTVVMTIGQTTAYINGEPFEMDVAPYITNGRTLIPARYLAEFFGQAVSWDGENRRAIFEENKSAAGDSNLEAWAVPMGAILTKNNYGSPVGFGTGRGKLTTKSNSSNYNPKITEAQYARDILTNSWSITNREDLISTVLSMTWYGHNLSFLYDAAIASSLTEAEMETLIAQSSSVDAFMWPYTKQLSEKWGNRGILCWDLFRMSNLVQWGYLAGYVTYSEALALLEPAAVLLKENFSSWDEAYENYLDGYHWWGRLNVLEKDVWETHRGLTYLNMKNGKDAAIFDDSLFTQEIIPVPGLSWTALYSELEQ